MSETTENSPEPSPAEQGGQVRICGYSQCGRVLPAQDRPGRKAEYCKDRRWEGGKDCRAMAAAERAAVKASGLDGPLAAYREVSGRLMPVLEAIQAQLGGPLDELVEAVRGVETGAMARVSDEEQTALAAIDRAEQADIDRNKAVTARNAAVQEAKEAREAKIVAERLMRENEADARKRVDDAWRQALANESEKAAAVARAGELKANLDAYVARFDKVAEEVNTLREANKKLTSANAAAEAERKGAVQARDEALALAEQRAGEATAAGNAKAAAEAERDLVNSDNQQLRAELEGVRADLADQQGAASALREQLAEATGREQGLRAELEGVRAELTAQQGLVGDLRQQLADAAGREQGLVAERDSANSTANGLRQQLAGQQEVLEGLRGELAETKARVATVEELRALIAPPKK